MVGTRPAKTRSDATVGNLLQAAREQRGLTLADVSTALHIPVKHLRCLEEGDLSGFAAEVYARGAFERYADYLGVRAEQTQRAFLRVLSGAREYVPLRVHRPRPWLTALLTPRWILAGVIACIALLVGSYIMWQVQSFLRLPALELLEPHSPVIVGSTATIRGQAEAGAQLKINGEAVLLDEDGMFTTSFKLHPGINIMQVEATNAAGRTRLLERHLLMPRHLSPQS